jgi:hypothetical protein
MNRRSSIVGLWPAVHLFVTADTSRAVDALLHPRRQLGFLDRMTAFAGPGIFAGALVYSTPRGNTGWTALRMGRLGNVTFHHWDMAKPSLLQLDVFGVGVIDERGALDAVREFWNPVGMRAVLVRRPKPAAKLGMTFLQDDLSKRKGTQKGLGPGTHLHLFVDQSGRARNSLLNATRLDTAVANLVALLNMRGTTPVMSRHWQGEAGFSYDAITGITSSHIALRLRHAHGRASIALDVFSCRNFKPDVVLHWLDEIAPKPETRRAIVYNRHPKGTFTEL